MKPRTCHVTPVVGRPCPIVIGSGVTRSLSEHFPRTAARAVLIADDRVGAIHGDRIAALLEAGLPVTRLDFPAGERNKTRLRKERLEDAMLDAGIGRDSVVVALGGGVALDLAGFTAATYMRGIPTLLLPTSLLAMVDAAIGGKTGVDTDRGKNLVGAFHHPLAVVVDVAFLETLPDDELPNGLAEMAKAGVVADRSLFTDLTAAGPEGLKVRDWSIDIIARSAAVKAEIVSRDAEEQGLRQVLNFGHTVGHALEQASGFALPHGLAVALGMAAESAIAVEVGILPASEREILITGLRALGLPVDFGKKKGESPLTELMKRDKKSRRGELRFSLPEAIGRMTPGRDGTFSVPVEPSTVDSVLQRG